MQTVTNWVCFWPVASSDERSLPIITWVNNKMCFAYCVSEPATSRIYVRQNKQLEGSPVPWDRTSNRNLRVYKYIAHVHVNMKGCPCGHRDYSCICKLLVHIIGQFVHARMPEPGNGPARCRQRSSKCIRRWHGRNHSHCTLEVNCYMWSASMSEKKIRKAIL